MSELISVELYHMVCKQSDALREENRRLRDALERITTEHCAYAPNHNSAYGIGVVDGHRCAAKVAAKALQPATPTRDGGEG